MEASQLEKYDEWLTEHMEELVTSYSGKVVAIQEGQIILVGDSETDIYQRISELHPESIPLVFRVPREEDLQSIL
ncbi:MAG: hypothetical protein FJ117_07995 [Deltaproteobacteria bacterium]|nr:hypothetical protein [Deltaproteobacteria bacterium]